VFCEVFAMAAAGGIVKSELNWPGISKSDREKTNKEEEAKQ